MALQADITKSNEEAYKLLDELGNKGHSIPYVAVFPADKPNQPRVLKDVFPKQKLIDILADCPEPKSSEKVVSATMP